MRPMNERIKITASHLSRQSIVYLRQSSAAQVEHNRDSTERQCAIAAKAVDLGGSAERVTVIDEDLGLSGSGSVARSGFARLTAEVALGHVGLVLGLEVSRLARNNADWHRLIDLCGLTDTLIGDADGIYHPSLFNDRLLLGLHRYPPCAHRPRLCRRLHLWQNSPRDDTRCGWSAPQTHTAFTAFRMAGAHPGASSRIYRLANL